MEIYLSYSLLGLYLGNLFPVSISVSVDSKCKGHNRAVFTGTFFKSKMLTLLNEIKNMDLCIHLAVDKEIGELAAEFNFQIFALSIFRIWVNQLKLE